MSGHTKGRVEAKRLFDNNGEPYSTYYIAHIDIGGICMVWAPPGNTGQEANAALIAEAFNVAHETGRTPAQLAAERAELVAAIRTEMSVLLRNNLGTHWQGCEDVHPKCAALKRMASVIEKINSDCARTIITKVKGPVQ